jgi:hypothetical protein
MSVMQKIAEGSKPNFGGYAQTAKGKVQKKISHG